MPKLSGKTSTPIVSKTSSSLSSSVNKSYSSYSTPKSNKPSVSLGIIWIPTRKNKKKDIVYTPHNTKYDYSNRTPSMYKFMSGDSPDYDPFKKKDEETNLLVPERTKAPVATIATAEVAAAAVDVCAPDNEREDKREFNRHDREENKEAAGDRSENSSKSDKDYLENNENIGNKSAENKREADKCGDKVDAVYLRPPPPHKARSTNSSAEEEDCGIKCLYYTLQCCDCVLM